MARQVVGDAARRGEELAVERSLLLALEQVLAEVHSSPAELLGGFCSHDLGVFLAEHVGAGRIDGAHLFPRRYIRRERLHVRLRQLLGQREVPCLQRRHAAAVLLRAIQGDAVFGERLDGVLSHLRVVVVHKAGDKQNCLGRVSRRSRLFAIPVLEGFPMEVGQQFVPVDSQGHFEP